jgi:hypothetical protein
MLFLLTGGGSKILTLKLFPERKCRKIEMSVCYFCLLLLFVTSACYFCLLLLFENLFKVDTFIFFSIHNAFHFRCVKPWAGILACGPYQALRIDCLHCCAVFYRCRLFPYVLFHKLKTSCIISLKINFVPRSTLRLGYKNQSVNAV